MFPRVILSLVIAFTVLLSSCKEKQKPSAETPAEKQSVTEKADEAASTDTTEAGRYFAKGREYSTAAKYDSAIIFFEKAKDLYEKNEDGEKFVHSYTKIGEQYRRKHLPDQAITTLNQALKIGLKHLDAKHLEIARIYYNLGIAYDIKQEPAQALSFLNQALDIRIAAYGFNHLEIAQTYSIIGSVYQTLGDFDQALAFHQKTLTLRLELLGENNDDVAITYINLGLVSYEKGDYQQSLILHQKAAAILSRNDEGQSLESGINYNNIANNYLELGDYDRAIEFYQKSLAILQSLLGADHPYVAQPSSNMGVAFDRKGEYDRALALYNQALSILRAAFGEQHPAISGNYMNQGGIFLTQNDFERAISLFNKALAIDIAQFGEKHPKNAYTHNLLGSAFSKKGAHQEALAYFQNALSIRLASLGEQHPEVAYTYNLIGDHYRSQNDYSQAIYYYQEAAHANGVESLDPAPDTNWSFGSVLSEPHLLQSLNGIADAWLTRYAKKSHKLADLEASVMAFELSLRLIDQMRRSYRTPGSKLLLAERATTTHEKAIQATIFIYNTTLDNKHKNRAFDISEKGKTSVLLESLSEADARYFSSIPDSLLEQERQLRIDLAFYDKSLAEENLKREDRDSAKIALWQDRVFTLKQNYDALLQKFEKNYPDYYNLKYQVNTASVQEVQEQTLDENTALVEYFVGADSIFIFVIQKDALEIASAAKDSLFEQRVKSLRAGIVTRNYAEYTQAASALYQTLLAPVADKLSVDNLIIVPDGVLNALPFEVLLTEAAGPEDKSENYSNLPYLAKKHTISYAYSATLLLQTLKRQHEQTKRDYLAFAPVFPEGLPSHTRGSEFFERSLALDSTQIATRIRGYLPASKKEVSDILNVFEDSYGFFERFFSQKSQVYLERDAREDQIKVPTLKDYRYLHFATHGFVNETAPKLSGLLLAQDTTSTEDGILYLGEIYNLDLNADLVTLSACETGLGQIAKGEGIIGLTRGFLYAGASNLLVSLWQVSDASTADLMVDFYRGILQGQSKAQALRAAKLELMSRNPEYAKPYYWAPFVLIGK